MLGRRSPPRSISTSTSKTSKTSKPSASASIDRTRSPRKEPSRLPRRASPRGPRWTSPPSRGASRARGPYTSSASPAGPSAIPRTTPTGARSSKARRGVSPAAGAPPGRSGRSAEAASGASGAAVVGRRSTVEEAEEGPGPSPSRGARFSGRREPRGTSGETTRPGTRPGGVARARWVCFSGRLASPRGRSRRSAPRSFRAGTSCAASARCPFPRRGSGGTRCVARRCGRRTRGLRRRLGAAPSASRRRRKPRATYREPGARGSSARGSAWGTGRSPRRFSWTTRRRRRWT